MNNIGIAEFQKVSFVQFLTDWSDIHKIKQEEYEKEAVQNIYNTLILPKRSTNGSCGYDFVCPCDLSLKPNESIKIPTGMRCKINNGWALKLYPRSSLGFQYRMQLDNTVGIIDSDYFHSDNEGHILVKITNDSKEAKTLEIKRGERFIQGIFLPYGIINGDNTETVRNGGFGSTGK